jgi:hypothetical protein
MALLKIRRRARLVLFFLALLFIFCKIFSSNQNVLTILIAAVCTGFGILFISTFPAPLKKILLAAFLLRLFAAFLNYTQLFLLEGSLKDSVYFVEMGFQLSQLGLGQLLANLSDFSTNIYSVVIALLFIVFSPSSLLPIFLNIFMGVSIVALVYKMAESIWNAKCARTAAWLAAFFPYLIIFSAVILREAFISFFFILSAWNILFYLRNRKLRHMIFAMAALICASFFHGIMSFGLIPVLLIFTWKEIRSRTLFISAPKLFLIFVLLAGLLRFFVNNEFKIYKLEFLFTSDAPVEMLMGVPILPKSEERLGTYRDPYEFQGLGNYLVRLPQLIIPFLAEPYPWRIMTYRYPIQYTSSLLWIFLAALILFFGPHFLLKDRRIRYLLFICFTILISLSFGSTQINQAIRHNCKVMPVILSVSAYYFERLRLALRLKKPMIIAKTKIL